MEKRLFQKSPYIEPHWNALSLGAFDYWHRTRCSFGQVTSAPMEHLLVYTELVASHL